MVKVSIIIPAYNVEVFLERAVNSALAQTYGNTEIIIVDNNSTDETFKVATDLASRHSSKIKVIKAFRQGCSAARNEGLKEAKGEWLQFLDADDILEKDKLTHQLSLIKATTAWVIGGYRIRHENNQEDLVVLPHSDSWLGWAYNYRAGNTCANLFHRQTLEELGGWNESYSDYTDPELHFRLLKAGVSYVVSKRVEMTYIQHSQTRISNTGDGLKQLRKANLLALAVDFLAENKPAYFSLNGPYFRASLLSSIRVLATTDLQQASELYANYFSPSLKPLDYSIVSRLVNLYPIWGFKQVERQRLRFGKYFSNEVKECLKRISRKKTWN